MKRKIIGVAFITVVAAMLTIGCGPLKNMSPPPAPPRPPAPGR